MQWLLANKVAAGFTSADNPHGGQESTLPAMYTMLYHWGAILFTPGYTDDTVFAAGGNPYGLNVTATGEALLVEAVAAARHMARRVVIVTRWLIAGREHVNDSAAILTV
jgi:NAD(P)H dehydrogenase (quinone)